MVRKKVKDSKVDTELVFAYAKTEQLGPLEEFISGTHQANLQSVGDRCCTQASSMLRLSKLLSWLVALKSCGVTMCVSVCVVDCT